MKPLIVIPVYNEEEYIQEVIRKVQRFSVDDILVIDDGSGDNSKEILRNIKGIRLLEHSSNQGYGFVLMEGFAYALERGYEVVLTMDCDDQHEPHLIPKFLEKIRDADIVSGSRYINPVPMELPPPETRKEINREITRIINQITSFGLTDTFCGFKAYKVEALKKLSLDEKGYGFPLQLWIQAYASGLSILEIPVGLIYKNYNRSFGAELDDSKVRLKHYKEIIKKELSRIQLPISAI
ncbi:MAG: glycosyltransferase family 2 protein [Nitrospinae bacterium]|nr:glycosyltransferase family 2 protein [Nitrospinota bacterium]